MMRLALSFMAILTVSNIALAAKTAKLVSATSTEATDSVGLKKKAKLSRDISFRGSQVDGKYLSAGESVAEVESEKNMGALMGIRKNFRDKLAVERDRLKAEGK